MFKERTMRRMLFSGCGVFFIGFFVGMLAARALPTQDGPAQIEIAAQSPDGPADLADRLVLHFDRPCVPPEKIGHAIDESPFQITPPRKGHWVFAAADQIAYQLEEKLESGRRYTLAPTVACDQILGAQLIGIRTVVFNTEPLRVDRCGIASSDRTHVNVEVTFNQPVNGAALHDAVTIRDHSDAESLITTVLTRQNTKRHTVRFERPNSTTAILTIDGSLTGANGDIPLGKLFEQQLTCQKHLELEYVSCYPDDYGKGATVRLNFNNRLSRKAAIPRISIVPPVNNVRPSIYYDSVALEGAFICGVRYTISIEPGLVARNESITRETLTRSVRVPDRDPQLRLTTGHGVLSPAGHMLLDIETINYKEIDAVITKLYPNNLVAHLHGGDADTTGREVVRESLTVVGARNALVKSTLNLGTLIDRQPGIYHVRIKGDKNYWHRDSAVIAVSDLAISARKQKDGIFCWVTSIGNAEPVNGVSLTAYSFTNQVLSDAVTDDQGRGLLHVPSSSGDQTAWVLVAEKAGDFSYLVLDRDNWSPEQNDLVGRPSIDTYDVQLYTERGAYRPGEVIHLTGILRDKTGHAPPPFPLNIAVARPDGQTLMCRSLTPDKSLNGFFHVDIPTPPSAQLGRYTVRARIPGSTTVLGKTTTLIENILPIRLDVTAAAQAEIFQSTTKPTIDIQANYLFGKPAAGLTSTITGRYVRKAFEAPDFDGFSFEPLTIDEEQVIATIDTTLDGSGLGILSVAPAEGPGWWEAQLAVTVTEPGSRSVSQQVSFYSDPLNRHLGIRVPTGNTVSVGAPIDVQWAQIAGDGSWAEGQPLALAVERIQYDWAIRESEGGMRWESTERRTAIESRTINQTDPSPSGTVSVTIPTPGQYTIRLTENATGLCAEWSAYVHRRGSYDESFAVAMPEKVDIKLDAASYVPGDTAMATIRASMKRTLLIALETDRVIWSQTVAMTGKTQTVEVPLPAELRRDAFLTASVIRPLDLDATKWMPLRARGIVRLPLEFNAHALEMALDAPKDARPGADITVVARLNDQNDQQATPAVVHMFAVDEGLLLPTAYRSPNPLAHFFAPRSASIEHVDQFNGLLPDFIRPRSTHQIGAGDDEIMSDMSEDDPLLRSPISLVRKTGFVAWQEALAVDENDEARFNFTAPATQGRLRVMAVAVCDDRYVALDARVVLSSPLMVEAQWPRFLSPGDEAWVPAKIFNQSDVDREIELTIDADDGLVVTDIETDSLFLAAGSTQTVWLRLVAANAGRPSIKLTARWSTEYELDAEVATSSGVIPIRPLSSIRTVAYTQKIPAGDAWRVPPLTGFIPGTVRGHLQIHSAPTAELLPAYEALIDYPYGCLEQTSSRLHGLICAREMVDLHADLQPEIDERIEAAIARIWSMQTPSGGLAFWPNKSKPHRWGTLYASQVILTAQAAGYDVNTELLQGIKRYLSKQAERSIPDANADHRGHHLSQLATITFVLAQLDAPPAGLMARLSEDVKRLDLEARSYLARAWLLAGDRNRASNLLSKGVLQTATSRALGGTHLTSAVRQKSALLEALLDLNDDHEPEHAVVTELLAARENGRWGTTLENATCLSALARYYRRQPKAAEYSGQIEIGNAAPFAFDDSSSTSRLEISPDDRVSVTSEGSGAFFVTCTHRGLAAEPVEPSAFDRSIEIRRAWLDAEGNQLDMTGLKVGDLIRARLTVSAPGLANGEMLHNVAIVDALPAAVEAENPALATSAVDQLDGSLTPDSVQFEDDRVLVFASIANQPATFEYHLRVVGRGEFVMPPVEASCMYDGSLASRHGGGRIVVAQ